MVQLEPLRFMGGNLPATKQSGSIWIIARTCFNQLQFQMFCSPMRRYAHWWSSSKAAALQPPAAWPYTHCPYILACMLIEICIKFDKIVMVHALIHNLKKVMSWWNLLHSPYLRPMIDFPTARAVVSIPWASRPLVVISSSSLGSIYWSINVIRGCLPVWHLWGQHISTKPLSAPFFSSDVNRLKDAPPPLF